MPLKRGTHSRGMSGSRKQRGGFWRLLTCTEGSVDDDERRCSSEEEQRRRRASERSRLMRMSGVKDCRPSKSSGKLERRRVRRSHGAATQEEITPNTVSSSADESQSKLHRRHRRRQDRLRCSMHSGTSGGRASVLDKSQFKATRLNRSGKRRKRLVVAMLEDGEDDGATESTRSGGYGARRMLRMRSTRDERKIRRILHQLSASITTSEERHPEIASAFSRAKKSPVAISRGQARPQPLAPVVSPISPQPTPSMPLPPPQMMPSPIPPPPHTQTAATADAVSFQPSQMVYGNNQLMMPPLLPQLSFEEPPNPPSSTRHSYGVKHFPDPTQAVTGSAFSNRRHGYRMFRRVFSAADNYYAVPFSPMESVKLSKDDDQWEDLEILVASHKGTETIKPKAAQSQSKIPTSAKNRTIAATFGKITKLPLKQAPAPLLKPYQPVQKLTETFGKQKPQQLAGKAALANASNVAGGDSHVTKPLPEKIPVTKPPLPAMRRQQQQQPQQHQPAVSQQLPETKASRSVNKHRPEVSKTHFNYMNRQQHQVQLNQQRRADPLSPHRLLSQLTQMENPTKDTSRLQAPSMLPRPTNPGRTSQIPLFRSEPTAVSGRIIGSNRCGKLNNMLLCGLRPK